jgi:hypothetical protein
VLGLVNIQNLGPGHFAVKLDCASGVSHTLTTGLLVVVVVVIGFAGVPQLDDFEDDTEQVLLLLTSQVSVRSFQ